MKNQDSNDQLLHDIFVNTTPSNFRSALLDDTLRRVRRKRRSRKTLRSAVVVAVLGLGLFLRWTNKPSVPPLTGPRLAKTVEVVETRALASDSVVHTRPFASEYQVKTVAFDAQVQTLKTQLSFRLINDRELLALAGEGRAALIRVSPGRQELIFVNPDDGRGLSPR